ncbi:MAG: Wzz/FepE/Etk N-terminal domain-containing protein [Candidatus Paceibacterota bacterium]
MDKQSNENEYQEIDLRDVINVVVKKIWLIAAAVAVAAVAAVVISKMLPKTYSISTSLEVGLVVKDGTPQIIERVGQVVEKKNKDVYGIQVRKTLGISQSEYPDIKTEIGKDTNIITFTAQSSKTDMALKILETVNGLIVDDHFKTYGIFKKELEDNIAAENKNKEQLAQKIVSLESEKNNYEKQASLLGNTYRDSFDVGTQVAFLNAKNQVEMKKKEIADLYTLGIESDKKINALREYLETMKPTTVIKSPVVSEIPVGPKTLLNMVLTALLALIAALFFVFAADWWKKSK